MKAIIIETELAGVNVDSLKVTKRFAKQVDETNVLF
jgi:hypothetical protein